MASDTLKNAIDLVQVELKSAHSARASRQDSGGVRLRSEIAEEPGLRKLIDEICLDWIENRRWPISPPNIAVLIWERLYTAWTFGAFLYQQGGLRAEQKSENEILVFLLIKTWEAVGVFRLRSRLFDIP